MPHTYYMHFQFLLNKTTNCDIQNNIVYFLNGKYGADLIWRFKGVICEKRAPCYNKKVHIVYIWCVKGKIFCLAPTAPCGERIGAIVASFLTAGWLCGYTPVYWFTALLPPLEKGLSRFPHWTPYNTQIAKNPRSRHAQGFAKLCSGIRATIYLWERASVGRACSAWAVVCFSQKSLIFWHTCHACFINYSPCFLEGRYDLVYSTLCDCRRLNGPTAALISRASIDNRWAIISYS